MITKKVLQQIIQSQKERLTKMDTGLQRKINGFSNLTSHAFIVTGIRRCGKSTLLQQFIKSSVGKAVYLNFEDPRLAGFDLSDFNRLHEIAEHENVETYFFDEIQLVVNWESFVRFRLDEGYHIFITGSNATMLSKELGTKLTGRHLSHELFPFSFREYIDYFNIQASSDASLKYLTSGGFPEFIKTGIPEILMQNFNDIIIRDIAIRYNIKNITLLQQLAVWLVTNIGKRFTGNSLKKLFAIASSSSMMEYLTYFANAYLFFYLPKFSYSGKVQLVNPKKVYCIDNGFVHTNSTSFSGDQGRLLENLVFLHLRRKTDTIYYFAEKNECDFVVFEHKKFSAVYQVCWELNQDNMDRELNGLIEAMEFFHTEKGYIITFDQTENFDTGTKTIVAKPFHEWALE